MVVILVVGDVHGDWASLNTLINRRQPEMILQCGDFGYWPGDRRYDPALKLKPRATRIHWIDGNHEDLKSLQALVASGSRIISNNMPNVIYQPRGSILELPDGRNVLFAGGAFSVDNYARLPGKDWFPDYEVLTEEELELFPDPSLVKIDIVISHTAPQEFNVKGLPYEQWPVWWDRSPDPSEKVLSLVLKRYQPTQWFLGHFHRFQKGEFRGCKWTALDYAGSGRQWWVELES